MMNGLELPMADIEAAFRDAALCCGRAALSQFLSEMPEAVPQCVECGAPMRNLGRRNKQIVTLLGECEFSRNYYGCDCDDDCNEGNPCHTHAIPKDEKLGVGGTRFTETVKRVTSQIAASDSFRDTSANIKMLCGIDVSAKEAERIAENLGAEIIAGWEAGIACQEKGAGFPLPEKHVKTLYIEYDGTGVPIRKKEIAGIKGKQADGTAKTREMKTGCIFTQSSTDKDGKPIRDPGSTTYFSAIRKSGGFSELVYSEAAKCGANYAEDVAIIGDGAKWIWNIADDKFPFATQIVDMYHAKEHISDVLRTLFSNGSEINKYKKTFYKLLERGKILSLVKLLAALPAHTEAQREKVRVEYNYFTLNKHRMQYQKFRKRGLFVGSGVIEAACKNVIGKRLKQSGMFWSVSGANKIAALRCAILSGYFEIKQTVS
jgi:hypothetical protein